MSEQLVIILLIALTAIIVLIALAIPDDPSTTTETTESLDMYASDSVPADAVIADESIEHELHPIDVSVNDEQGAVSDDARRATDVPEEAGR